MCDNLSSSAEITPSKIPTDEATNRNGWGNAMKRGRKRGSFVEEVKEDTYLNITESFTCEGNGSEKSTRKVGSTISSSSSFLGLGESTSVSSGSTALESSPSVKSLKTENANTSLESSPSSSKSVKENGTKFSKLGVLRKGTSAEVVGEGTKLMKSIKFPTVIIRLHKASLQSSMVFYVIMESESGEFVGKIPALLFSCPYYSSKRTQYAEMLPLCVHKSKEDPDIVSLTPMLLHRCYKRMFSKRCSFEIKAIESGRLIDWSVEYPWNIWNLGLKDIQSTLTQYLYQDIREIPMTMAQTLSPLRRCTTFSNPKSGSDNVVSLSECFSKRRAEVQQDSADCKLSDYCTNLKFSGVAASGVSTFAEWFKALPPNVHVDKDFKCDRGTTLSKDMFSDMQMFERYLCISDTI